MVAWTAQKANALRRFSGRLVLVREAGLPGDGTRGPRAK
jgi:hypothetical protein